MGYIQYSQQASVSPDLVAVQGIARFELNLSEIEEDGTDLAKTIGKDIG